MYKVFAVGLVTFTVVLTSLIYVLNLSVQEERRRFKEHLEHRMKCIEHSDGTFICVRDETKQST
jgi:hypothetical protein